MQPYIFPYIGYFQLICSVDKFVIYDDVNFIKQGWINRNNILLNADKLLFSIPLENLTSFKKIKDTRISSHLYNVWLNKFAKTLSLSYKKAPYFDCVFPILIEVLEKGKVADSISSLCTEGIRMVLRYLDIEANIIDSSLTYQNDHLNSCERILDICEKESADTYINAIGGEDLYSKDLFKRKGIDLYFIKNNSVVYRQFAHDFVPNLSIIDILMFNSTETIRQYMQNFNLI